MIDRNHDLPVTRQAELVGLPRSTVYYLPRPVSETELALMRRIVGADRKVIQNRGWCRNAGGPHRIIQILVAAEVVAAIDGSLGRRRAGSILGRRQQTDSNTSAPMRSAHQNGKKYCPRSHSAFRQVLNCRLFSRQSRYRSIPNASHRN